MDFKRFLSLKKPCANCPFLKENGIAIGEERLAEIKQSLLDDDMTPFQCHKTTHPTGGHHDTDGILFKLPWGRAPAAVRQLGTCGCAGQEVPFLRTVAFHCPQRGNHDCGYGI